MEYFSSHIDDKDTLCLLNNCRLYLQIFTLADITSTNGKTITKCSLAGIRNPSYQTTLHWPKQTRPLNKTWKTFVHIVRTLLCKPNSITLKKPLGPWKNQPNPFTKWNHFYDPLQKRLYKHHNRKINPWTYHRPTTSNQYIFNYSPGMPAKPPQTLHRIMLDSYTPTTWIYTPHTHKINSTHLR